MRRALLRAIHVGLGNAVSHRVKLLMLCESAASSVTILLVAARRAFIFSCARPDQPWELIGAAGVDLIRK
jgi:hypothetical protein